MNQRQRRNNLPNSRAQLTYQSCFWALDGSSHHSGLLYVLTLLLGSNISLHPCPGTRCGDAPPTGWVRLCLSMSPRGHCLPVHKFSIPWVRKDRLRPSWLFSEGLFVPPGWSLGRGQRTLPPHPPVPSCRQSQQQGSLTAS